MWLLDLQDLPRNKEDERQEAKGTNQSNLLPFKELSGSPKWCLLLMCPWPELRLFAIRG